MADYISQFTGSEIDQRLAKVPQLESGKQDKLVSGSNIKTINGQSVLGSGDMQIQAGDTDAVKYVAQTLTDAQKAQARTNIAAASAAELGQIVTDLTGIEADIDSLEAAVAAINVGDYVTATTLPTASASTMGHIYLIGPDANNNYDRYFTQESGGSYSWVSLGSTQIDLSTYATQAEVDQLEAEVDGNLMSSRAKNALLAVFNKVAFAVPDVSAEMTELENALFNLDEIVGIEATYNQGETAVYDQGVSTLDELGGGLVVKAVYGDGTKITINNYILSGDISTAGTSEITASYTVSGNTFTDTFDVVVTHYTAQMVYKMSDSDIGNYKGGLTRKENNSIFAIWNYGTADTRRVFLASSGDAALPYSTSTQSTGKYPIPIPRNARKVTVAISPSTTQNVSIGIGKLVSGFYRADISGWALTSYELGSISITFTESDFETYRKGGWYLILGGSPVSSYSGNEPTEVVVTFE